MKKIVVTGGPGAGKTALLEMARRHFSSSHIAVLAEAATILYGGGFPRAPDPIIRRAAQRAIYYVQRELERIATDQGTAQVILCDRGTLDGLAYWPGPAEEWLAELGTTIEAEYARYDTVIHLRTPSKASGYNLQNHVRVETPQEAAAIDVRIAEVWANHPNRFVVEANGDFFKKVLQALEVLREQITQVEAHP